MPSTMMKQSGAAARTVRAMALASAAIPVTGEVWMIVATRVSGVMAEQYACLHADRSGGIVMGH